MEYKKVIYEGVTIHAIKTDKFKRCVLQVDLMRKANKNDMTERLLLNNILADSNQKYPSSRELLIAQQDLYGSKIDFSVSTAGDSSIGTHIIKFLNPKYTDKGELIKNVNFLFDSIYLPNIKNNQFDQIVFDSSVYFQKNRIKSLFESKGRYSFINLLHNVNENMPSGFSPAGYLEDFDRITPSSMVNYYNEYIKQETNVFFVGNINLDEVIEAIKDRIPKNIKHLSNKVEEIIQTPAKEVRVVKEIARNNQSELVMGATIHSLTDRERFLVLPMYRNILGGGTSSLLFNNVREKKSLCYSIGSIIKIKDNLLIISTSIADENYDLTVNEIKRNLQLMEDGKFTIKQMNNVRRVIINDIKNNDNDIYNVLREYIFTTIFGHESKEYIKENIKSVTKQEIMNFAKKVKLHTIYFLSTGGQNEES